MAQLGTERRLSEACITPTTPTSENLRTFEQVIQGEEATWSLSPVKKNHEQEDDRTTPTKKSVLTKVKEKAKKLRSSLSGKKLDQRLQLPKYNCKTPPWGVTLDNDDDEDDDSPQNLRTPTYESELGHDNYKNVSNKHQQQSPVASKKNVFESKHESPLGSNKQLNKFTMEKLWTPKTKATLHYGSKCSKSDSAVPNVKHVGGEATLGQTDRSAIVGERAYSISPTTARTGSNIGGLAGVSPRMVGSGINGGFAGVSPRLAGSGINGGLVVASPRATDRSIFLGDRAIDTGNSDDGNSEIIEHRSSMSPQTTDKGVSMKAYFRKKFEPGKDERSLSQVISNAISPRKSTDHDTRVMAKMKDAVNSLLRPEQEPSKSSTKTINSSPNSPAYRDSNLSKNGTSCLLPNNFPPKIKTSSSLRIPEKPVAFSRTNSSLHGPVFVNPYEEEGNCERRLQTN